ncbi:NAD(P)/FAD-dependent oxidoreductase [Roseburia hominis]
MKKQVLIVGGGAAGMMAAITAAENGAQVMVLEQNGRVGKKILSTGNGRCNFTNLVQNPDCYRSENPGFPWEAVCRYDSGQVIRRFLKLGIYAKNKNGCLYPFSEQASAVLDVLRMEMEQLGVQVHTGEKVTGIEKRENRFVIHSEAPCVPEQMADGRLGSVGSHGKTEKKGKTQKESISRQPLKMQYHTWKADSVILANGSRASAVSGSDGSGYALAKSLGHSLIPVVPALVQLKCREEWYKALAGIRVHGKVSLYIEGRLAADDTGEIQLTGYGISGIPVFQVSRYAARGLKEQKKVRAVLDFMPDFDDSAFETFLDERIENGSGRKMEQFFTGLFHKKLAGVLLKRAQISAEKCAGALDAREKQRLLQAVKRFETAVTDTNSFENAQICAGGVNTREVSSADMQSLLVPGVYFAGELLDVDGICGGYNLQWAWSSGYLAGKGAAR